MGQVNTLRPTLGGVAIVCCPHDREKRQITTESQVAELGLAVGQTFDPKQHRVFSCACCSNLFVDPGDVPLYCHACRGSAVHPLGGPLAEPTGRLT